MQPTGDLLSWLRSALDEHERIARRVSDCDCPGDECVLADIARRTVAAHREILAEHRPEADIGWEPGPDLCGTCRYDSGLDRYVYPCPTIRSLTAIYRESHPGFDPSWIGESDGR